MGVRKSVAEPVTESGVLSDYIPAKAPEAFFFDFDHYQLVCSY